MDSYRAWAARVNDFGLARGYSGGYFPAEWQIITWSINAASDVGLSAYAGLRVPTLLCDVGAFFVLAALLRRLGLDARYAWIYWVSPFFVMIAWLGDVDAQTGFFLLLALYIVVRWPTQTLAAGVPLGVAFFMKPQVETVILAIAAYVVGVAVAERTWRRSALHALKLLIMPTVFLAPASLYFYRSGFELTYLARSFRR